MFALNLLLCYALRYFLSTFLNAYHLIVPDPALWATVTDSRMCEKIFLRPSLDEIYDLQWSPDSMFVLAGAINSKVLK